MFNLKKRILQRLKWTACLSLLCLSCQNNLIYHFYQPVPTSGWSKSDTITYTLPDELSAGSYRLFLGIRHQETYPYRDLWLSVNQLLTDSLTTIQHTDSVHLYLANEKGSWIGDGIGGTRQYLSNCPMILSIPKDKKVQIKIIHIMKDQPLLHINDVGIQLEKNE